ncbi:hypothetical protein Hanom_Chr04g00332371 [Helianthus anomalus]
MLKKVLEDLIGKPIEQRFEEIELMEVRARREVEMQVGMKDKGKDVQVEDVVQVPKRAIVSKNSRIVYSSSLSVNLSTW